jgi:uncharacterized protein (TIGR03437 family)
LGWISETSMKSYRATPFRESNCRTPNIPGHNRAFLFILPISFCTSILTGQTAGSITNHSLPVSGFFSVIDVTGNVYFAGRTGPVTAGAPQTRGGGGTCFINVFPVGSIPEPCSDAYVGKVDPEGNVLFGTLLGGPTADQATALAVDAAGNLFIAGVTGGSFPTTAGAAMPASTTAKVFAAKLSADGSRFLYSTYLPDTAATASAIAIDAQGVAYIAGTTTAAHAYVAKLSPNGSTILYYGTLPGSKSEAAKALLVDIAGNVVVAGYTTSPDFPVSPGVVQSRLAGTTNLFIARLDSTGKVARATYLGGSGADIPTVLQADSAGNIYVGGSTSSLDFPTTPGVFQSVPIVPGWNEGAPFGFVAKISTDFLSLAYSTYVMTSDRQFPGVGVLAVTPSGDAYLAGTGAGFPVTESAPQTCFQGPLSAFVAHLDPHGALLEATYVGRNTDFPVALSLAADGTILLAWSSFSPPNSVLSRIRFGGARWRAPACLSESVLNSATLYGDDQGVAPGELITLTGFGIGPDACVAYQPDEQGMAPRQLAGERVLFDGEPAPVLYAQSRQVNAQAPFELSGKTLTNISLVYNQVTVGSMTVRANQGRPGIFRLQAGVSSQAVALNQDGTLNGVSNPAARGSIVAVWGTGFPPIDAPCSTGGLNPSGPVNLAAGWRVAFGIEAVVYAGSAPGLLCGIVQINLVVPASGPAIDRLLPQFGNPLTNRAGGRPASESRLR